MDSKTLISKIAQDMGTDTKTVTQMVAGLVEVISQRTSEMDSIAIPGFGNFVSVKKPERIDTDPATGVRRLMPPRIMVEFIASTTLKKRLAK